MEEAFQVHDKVVWTSESQAHRTTKTGVIVAIVSTDRDPYLVLPRGYSTCGQFGMPRNHTSYLVQVGNSKRLYWPRVSQLKRV